MSQITYLNFLFIDFSQRKKDIETFNAQNRWRKRGIATVPMDYAVHIFGYMNALVTIYHGDGTVVLTHGGIEMGQGINTKVAQIAAHILKIPLDMISVRPTNNATSSNSYVSGGSISSETVGYAVMKACEILLERIKPIRDTMKDAKWQDVIGACYTNQIDLMASYSSKQPEIKPYTVYGCTCAEIEVDLLTGNLQLLRIDIL